MNDNAERPILVLLASHWVSMLGVALVTTAGKTCHGGDGTANPAIAKMKVDFQDLKSAGVQSMTDDDLKKVITDGRGKMKPVNGVSGAALDNVVAYVRSLKK